MREIKTDFETEAHEVQSASVTRRPDAISSDYRSAFAPGPWAIGNVGRGLFARAWRVQADHEAGEVTISGADESGSGWQSSELLVEFNPANEIVQLALAFDASGNPHIAAERSDGFIWVYREGQEFQQITEGRTPVLATFHDELDGGTEAVLFYIRDGEVRWRTTLGAYQFEIDTGRVLTEHQYLEGRAVDDDGVLHLAYSTRDPDTGTWSLDWYSSAKELLPVTAICGGGSSCIGFQGESEYLFVGDELVLTFRGNTDGSVKEGWLQVPDACSTAEIDALLVGAGGDHGNLLEAAQNGGDTIIWASAGGAALDPDLDPPVHVAHGGGKGGSGGVDGGNGEDGGSGGGGGAKSPADASGHTAGGGALNAPGMDGGAGMMSQGLLFKRRAAAGGGGSPFEQGEPGNMYAKPPQGGRGGQGGPVPTDGFGTVSVGGGGDGDAAETAGLGPGEFTGQQGGGGGVGGVLVVTGLALQAGARIKVQVGSNNGTRGLASGGTVGSMRGGPGLLLIRERVRPVPTSPAASPTGGDEQVVYRGYAYNIYRTDGTLTVSAAGGAEAIVIGGGGGGGTGAGGGGGAGAILWLREFTAQGIITVTVGQGGAGGASGVDGADGGESSLVVESINCELARCVGGGGGGSLFGGPGHDGGSGGGGHGDASDPVEAGDGKVLRGTRGGQGRGFLDSGASPVRYGGGGGGVGGAGDEGATEEFTGNPLSASWTPNGADWNLDPVTQRLLFNGGASIAHNDVSQGEMLVQGRLRPLVSIPASGSDFVHLMARLSPGDNLGYGIGFSRGSVATGLAARIFSRTSTSGLSTSLVTIAAGPLSVQDYDVELYVADSVQEGWIDGLGTASATNTDHNGQNARSAGWYDDSTQVSEGDNFRVFKGKRATISGLSAGETVRVLDAEGAVVATASESGGQARPSLSNHDTGRKMPNAGYPTVQVLDAGMNVVASYASGGVYPGAEMTRAGAAVTFDHDVTLDLPINGIVAWDDFDGQTPGPQHGDGGDGIDLSEFLIPGHTIRMSTSGTKSWDEAGTDGAEVDVIFEVRPGSVASNVRIRLIARGDPGTSARTGYFAGLRGGGSSINLLEVAKYVAGTFTSLGTVAVSFGLSDNIRVRLQCTGTTIRAKAWDAEDPEPGSWMVSATDASHASGYVAVNMEIGQHEFSYICVNKSGGTAPGPESIQGPNDLRTFFEDQTPGEAETGWAGRWGTDPTRVVIAGRESPMLAPVVAGDDIWFAAGGGGGSESVLAGAGGRGGGGDGSFAAATNGGNGVDDTGSGGGGAGDPDADGGDGGNGIVIVRTRLVA